MTSSPNYRTLATQLRSWTAKQLARLVARRPDLVTPRTSDLEGLANRAEYPGSIRTGIDSTTLPETRLLQLVVCCRPGVLLEEVRAMLPEGVSLDDVDPVLASLEDAALVWRHDGRLYCSGALREVMPTTLGPPARPLLERQNVDYVKQAIRNIRAELVTVPSADLPPSARGARKGKPPRKDALLDELEALLGAPGAVNSVLQKAPTEARDIARSMAEGTPLVHLTHSLYFSTYRYNSPYYTKEPTYWLFERALLLPDRNGQVAWQPREVGVALRGGRPVPDLALDEPVLANGGASTEAVNADAARQAIVTLDALSDILDRWADAPVKELKSRGLGANALKQVARSLETTPEEAARLVELLHLAGLIESREVTRKAGRQWAYEYFVEPSDVASTWMDQPPVMRWRQLAQAWLRAEHWPSATGRKRAEGKAPDPVLSYQGADDAPARRREVLAALAGLGGPPVDGQPSDGTGPTAPATATAALADWVYWRGPQPWLGHPVAAPPSLIGWTYEEAECLGLVANGRLSSFGEALFHGDGGGAERLFTEAAPAVSSAFTLQADMTVVVVGRLDRDRLTELRLLADIESKGAATTFRISEASVRRAIDAGRTGDAILAFLRKYADKGVPQALEYLVSDVARRHGHLLLGTAQSFITAEDPAVLADACSHRRTRKLALRQVAPTVAVSSHPPDKLLAGLRDAGFFPAPADGEASNGQADNPRGQAELGNGNVIALRPDRSGDDRTGAGAGNGDEVVLPEPYIEIRFGRPSTPPAVEPEEAAALARAVVEGRPTTPSFAEADPVVDGQPARLPFDDPGGHYYDEDLGLTDLDEVGDWDEVERLNATMGPNDYRRLCVGAAEANLLVGLAVVDDDDPIVLAIEDTDADSVTGQDMVAGRPRTIDYSSICAVIPLEPETGSPRSTPNRRRRKR